jgi:hypothetical protein
MEVDLAGHAASKTNDEAPAGAAGQPLPVVLDVGDIACPDLGTVEALCLIALEVRRCEGRVRLEGASAELRELIDLAGLARVLPPDHPRRRAAERHATDESISSQASARPGSR